MSLKSDRAFEKFRWLVMIIGGVFLEQKSSSFSIPVDTILYFRFHVGV